jgi:hypothetical protein
MTANVHQKNMATNVSIGSVHHESDRRKEEKKSEGERETGNIRLLLTYALTDHIVQKNKKTSREERKTETNTFTQKQHIHDNGHY